jgi:hypothetical protein
VSAVALCFPVAESPAQAQDVVAPKDAAVQAAPASPISVEEVAQLRALVEALSARVQELETTQKKVSAAMDDKKDVKNVPTVSSASKSPIVLSGLVQVRGDAFFGQKNAGGSPDTFRLRRAEIRVTAPAITSRLSGTVLFDLSKRMSLSGTPVSGVNQSSNILQEAQISYLLRKARGERDGSGNISLDAGQFKIPVGFEGDLVSSSAIPTIERALMFAARDSFGGGYGDIRDTGVQLRGTQGQFRYWLGVFNGLGERQNNDATSDTKALVGRIAYNPRGLEGLTVGLSGARGDSRNVGTAGGVSQRADRSLLNAFVNYQNAAWTARAEYLSGNSQRLPMSTAAFENDIRAYYGLVGYKFTPKLEGVLRYDFLNLDRGLGGAAVRDLVLGVNYYMKGNNAKIQANVVRRRGGSAISAANGFSSSLVSQFAADRTEFRVQAQVGF